MLLVGGVLAIVIGIVVIAATAFANGMSDAPQSRGMPIWPGVAAVALGVACLIARHWVHGPITW